MITTFYPPHNFGGDGIFVYKLSNELARRGHRVDVVHCVDAYRTFKKEVSNSEFLHHPNVTVHSLRSGFGFLSPLLTQQTGYPFFKGGKIDALIADKKFDVINYHNMSLIGLQVLGSGNAIKFYTTHEHWLVCPMHVLWKFGQRPCDKRDCVSCQIIGGRPVQWWRHTGLMKKWLVHVDKFISPSSFTMKKHREMGLHLPFSHIPNFLPTFEYGAGRPSENLSKRERPYFLYVGRLEKIKGVQSIIPVFRKYDKCDLLIAGEGPHAGTLHRLTKDAPNIDFLGQQPYSSLRQLYQNALAVIVPSLCYEVFGIVILEAFAEKTPVIVNNIAALNEIVEQSQGGLIYDNEKELLAHLDSVRRKPHLRRELGDRGYRAYRAYWTEEEYINKYYRLILEVAAHKNVASPAIDALQDEIAGTEQVVKASALPGNEHRKSDE